MSTLSPMSDRTTGFRKVVRLGNSQTNSWTINDLPSGTYYWSVQAIDGVFPGLCLRVNVVAVNVPLPGS
ncbi:MAG: hypothetical protein IPG53_17320 [Ignavibacteriales bacterium]|nr:hypothetical protein [Ignavibacteriales bacterium]